MIPLKERIELSIFRALNPDTSIVHYDLVLFGYSSDKERGKEQIVIGMVMADEIPIYHQVWPGNTVDPKTLESTLTVLEERFHVKNVIFIGDRAFGRTPSLNLLDRNLYIIAAYRWDRPYRDVLMETDFSDGIVTDDLVIKEVKIDASKIADPATTEEEMDLIRKRRHIAVYNRKREGLDLRDIDDKIGVVNRKINECPNLSDLKKSLGELKSFVKFTKDGVTLDHRLIEMMRRLSGRFLIITNTDLKVKDAVSSYKEQWQIERSFQTIKSFLEIRPVYHRKSERIRAHVFVFVLSLLISRLIEKSSPGMSIESIADILSGIKAIPVKSPMKIVYCSGSMETISLLNHMGIKQPDHILIGALPKTGAIKQEYFQLEGIRGTFVHYLLAKLKVKKSR